MEFILIGGATQIGQPACTYLRRISGLLLAGCMNIARYLNVRTRSSAMRFTILLNFLLATFSALAQPYSIGSRTLVFTDAARSRNIEVLVHYPALSSGTNAEPAEGTFPVLVHGHGFVMGVDAYVNLRDNFVPRGYYLLLPTTEGGLLPDHAAFGADLRFLAQRFQEEGVDPVSPFFERVSNATALMGHSMGGGASFLGAAGNADIRTLVNFAPAETNPSAIAAAALVEVPTLVFGATEDCVTPVSTNQLPMYNAVPAACKAFINVVGGGHCFFGANSFTCSFGEVTCGPDLTISREEQHAIVNDFAGLWLDRFLKDDDNAFIAFQDSLMLSTRVVSTSQCLSTQVAPIGQENTVYPIPTAGMMRVQGPISNGLVRVWSASGAAVSEKRMRNGYLDMADLPDGIYHLEFVKDQSVGRVKVVVLH